MILFHCRRCLDVGWVLVRVESNEATPCPSCNPDQYDRWKGGAFAPTFYRVRAVEDTPDPARAAESLEEARRLLGKPAQRRAS